MASITTTLITKLVKNNSQTININLKTHPEFEQGCDFKVFKNNTQIIPMDFHKKEKKELDTTCEIAFSENSIINIPKKLNDLFDNHISDNYYLFGLPKKNSFLMALLYIISHDFKLKKDGNDKNKFIDILLQDLVRELPKYYKEGSYSSKNLSHNKIEENLRNNSIDKGVVYYISDYYNINLILLDYNTMRYHIGLDYSEDKKNVIIIKNYQDYIPLIHIYGEHPSNLIFKSIINKLEIKNKLDIGAEPNTTKKLSFKVKHNSGNDKTKKFKLKSINSYKLHELQEIATKNNIDTHFYGDKNNKKNKTKSKLYEELKLIEND